MSGEPPLNLIPKARYRSAVFQQGTTPVDLLCPGKLSRVEPDQYLDGRSPGNIRAVG